MRFKHRDYVRDQLGNAVASASIYVYLAGTETAATIYDANSAGSTLATAPQLSSDSSGMFEFWVDDGDYDQDQKFKLVISKTGFVTVTDDYIDIFPNLSNYIMSKDIGGEKWYSKPNADDGGLVTSKTKGDIVP